MWRSGKKSRLEITVQGVRLEWESEAWIRSPGAYVESEKIPGQKTGDQHLKGCKKKKERERLQMKVQREPGIRDLHQRGQGTRARKGKAVAGTPCLREVL